MSVEGLMNVTDKMMDYLIDKRDNLNMTETINGELEEVFGDREKAHMADVKNLFLQGKQFRDLSAITLLMVVLYMLASRRKWLIQWLNQLKLFFITSFIVIGALGALFATDFNKYFTMFHEVFFDNDLWMLDPRTDILINMVPEIFFFQTVMLIVIGFILSIVLILLLSRYTVKEFGKSV
jgi:integral membrane protein (TIGR01906 family)